MHRDAKAILGTILLHGALAFALTQAPKNPRSGHDWVTVEVRKPPAPIPPAPPMPEVPPPPPPPRPRVARRQPRRPVPMAAPIPNQTPPRTPPKEPPKPVFGVTMASTTTGDSSFSVPTGNTTVTDPRNVGRRGEAVQPLPAAPLAPPAPAFRPASPLEIESEADFDENSCGHLPYPDGEAKQLEIEGTTQLRVELDEHGKVHGVRIVKGVGHGLDELAVHWMKTRCRFPRPAMAKGGRPVASVITHFFNWQIDR